MSDRERPAKEAVQRGPFAKEIAALLENECTGRRVVGLPGLLEHRQQIRSQMNALTAGLRELTPEIERKCTHARNQVVHETLSYENTLGSYDRTEHYLKCKDCGKRWRLGAERYGSKLW